MDELANLVRLGQLLADTLGAPALAQWLTTALVLLVSVLAAAVVHIPLVILRVRLRDDSWIVSLIVVVCWPLTLLAGLYSLIFNIKLLFPPSLSSWLNWTGTALDLLANLTLMWIVLRYVTHLEHELVSKAKRDGQLHLKLIDERIDRSTLQTGFFIVRLVVFVIFVLMVLQVFGVSIGSILAFGGVSGILVGYAARDFLSNLFSGLRLFIYRPFEAGDWIKCASHNIEGVVEQIGWQNLRIRTFDKRPLYIPNALLALSVVENAQQMTGRRIYEYFGLRYEDIDRVDAVVSQVRSMLDEHPDVKQNETKLANFDRYGGSSLDCVVYCIVNKTKWVEYQMVKEDILKRIATIVHGAGADFAFPTQTLHIEQDDRIGLVPTAKRQDIPG